MKRLYKTFKKCKKDSQANDKSKKREGIEVVIYKCREPGHIQT